MRRNTRKIKVGNLYVGGDAPISIQSMTNTPTQDAERTVNQIKELERVGCDIVRVAVSNDEDLEALPAIKANIHIPLIVDIQYNARLAVESIRRGADCLRINPGNIGGEEKTKQVVNEAKKYGVSMRIGVNGGSTESDLLQKYGSPTADALVESAMRYVEMMERMNFHEFKLSLKSSDVATMMDAYRKISKRTDYPLHLGVTEAGAGDAAIIKSAIGIGGLLMEGIGDTIRVSLTQSVVDEVRIAKEILRAAGCYEHGVNLISCPTCSRTKIDLVSIVEEAREHLQDIFEPITVAIMGCPVNGPGEAREADFGIAGENGQGIVFSKGKVIRRVPEEQLLQALLEEIRKGISHDT